jgi:hypothetical protein
MMAEKHYYPEVECDATPSSLYETQVGDSTRSEQARPECSLFLPSWLT